MVSKTKAYRPFHDDHRPSITIKDDTIWACWPCNFTGCDVIKFVELKLNISFKEAIKWFENYLGYSNKKIVSLRKDDDKDNIKEKYSFYFLKIENKITKEIKKKKELHPKTAHSTYCELDSYDVVPKSHKEFDNYKKELFNLYKKVQEL